MQDYAAWQCHNLAFRLESAQLVRYVPPAPIGAGMNSDFSSGYTDRDKCGHISVMPLFRHEYTSISEQLLAP